MRIKKCDELLLEKSIGSEEIRNKYYSDIPKSIFYKIVNIDPTSVRKKDFSKPGKYCKWLLQQYKKGNFNDILNDEELIKKLNYYLFIFSTSWWKKKTKIVDIFKYKEVNGYISSFISAVDDKVNEYEKITDKSKFAVVYSDDKVTVLIPLNYTASYNTAKNTHWCTSTLNAFSTWSQTSILFRIIPKFNTLDKVKLTWMREENSRWYIACSHYPELAGDKDPFEEIEGMERWDYFRTKKDNDSDPDKYSMDEKWISNSIKIKDTMSLLSREAKDKINYFYNKYRDSKIEEV